MNDYIQTQNSDYVGSDLPVIYYKLVPHKVSKIKRVKQWWLGVRRAVQCVPDSNSYSWVECDKLDPDCSFRSDYTKGPRFEFKDCHYQQVK